MDQEEFYKNYWLKGDDKSLNKPIVMMESEKEFFRVFNEAQENEKKMMLLKKRYRPEPWHEFLLGMDAYNEFRKKLSETSGIYIKARRYGMTDRFGNINVSAAKKEIKKKRMFCVGNNVTPKKKKRK